MMHRCSQLAIASCAFSHLSVAGVTDEACDTSLLQLPGQERAHRSVDSEALLETDPVAAQARGWLGWGHEAAKDDLWDLELQNSESVFTDSMPDSCFKEHACKHGFSADKQKFDDVDTWANYLGVGFNLNASGGYQAVKASIDASFGKNIATSGQQDRNITYAMNQNRGKCYRLVQSSACAYNEAWLQPEFLKRLMGLGHGDYSENAMKKWKVAFIQRFGTHLAMKSSHGAKVQSTYSILQRTESNTDCSDAKLCGSFGWLPASKKAASSASPANSDSEESTSENTDEGGDTDEDLDKEIEDFFKDDPKLIQKDPSAASKPKRKSGLDNLTIAADMCIINSRCENTTSFSKDETRKCVALGGEGSKRAKMCLEEEPSEEEFVSWINSGDLSSSDSIIGLTLVPIWEFLTNLDYLKYWDAAETLKKAAEYSNCAMGRTPPVQEWTNSECKCVRECKNGGVLDAATCTCTCPGEPEQGFHGDTCEKTYGRCQPGVGTGNLAAAKKCPVNGRCESWSHKEHCTATEVCCATNFGTTCCPYGNTCKCGASKCQCVPPS